MRPSRLTLALLAAVGLGLTAEPARAQIAIGASAPTFTKPLLGGGSYTFTPVSSRVRVLVLFGYSCPFCIADGPTVQQQIKQHYDQVSPGEVEVIGVDMWNGSAAQVNNYKNSTGSTFPLMLNGTVATGGNVETLYGPFDNYLVIDKQGIVRYHAALNYAHGNRFKLNEIRAAVDAHVAGFVDVPGAGPGRLALAASPNPTQREAAITFTLPRQADDARVSVHDLSGRTVAVLHEGAAAAGTLSLRWDGRDASGQWAPVGLYLVRARTGSEVLTRRLTLVR